MRTNFLSSLSWMIALSSIFCSLAFAEESAKNKKLADGQSYKSSKMTDAKGKSLTMVDFEDANIDGQAKAPDGFYLQSRSQGGFHNILQLRKNFRQRTQISVPQSVHD